MAVGRHRSQDGIFGDWTDVIGTVDGCARRHNQETFRRTIAQPFKEPRGACDRPQEILKRKLDRQSDRSPAGEVKNLRWQTLHGRKRVQIGGIDLAIQPALQAESPPIRLRERPMAEAVDRFAAVRQLTDEMAADKAVCPGDPDRHDQHRACARR